jgi:hypothetical protein
LPYTPFLMYIIERWWVVHSITMQCTSPTPCVIWA